MKQHLAKLAFIIVFFAAFFSLGAATVIRLTTQVVGVLPVANGGTNSTGLASGQISAFCESTVGAVTATRYMLNMFHSGANILCSSATSVSILEMPMPITCTAQKLYVTASAAGGAAGSGKVTLNKNGTPDALTCTMGTGTSCNDTTHTVSLTAGDTFSLDITTGQTTDTTANVRATFQCI